MIFWDAETESTRMGLVKINDQFLLQLLVWVVEDVASVPTSETTTQLVSYNSLRSPEAIQGKCLN